MKGMKQVLNPIASRHNRPEPVITFQWLYHRSAQCTRSKTQTPTNEKTTQCIRLPQLLSHGNPTTQLQLFNLGTEAHSSTGASCTLPQYMQQLQLPEPCTGPHSPARGTRDGMQLTAHDRCCCSASLGVPLSRQQVHASPSC